jgi:hypothetical protein
MINVIIVLIPGDIGFWTDADSPSGAPPQEKPGAASQVDSA